MGLVGKGAIRRWWSFRVGFCLLLFASLRCTALILLSSTHPAEIIHNDGKPSNLDSTLPKKRVFIFGVGYVGEKMAKTLLNHQYDVSGTCTTNTKVQTLRNLDIRAHILNGNVEMKDIHQDLLDSDAIVSCVPPVVDGSGSIRDPAFDCFQQVFEASSEQMRSKVKWLGYISSTGVYGDCNGAWVAEDRPVNPTAAKARARHFCEQQWMQLFHAYGLPVHIFRVAGIYGPGRSVVDNALQSIRDSGSLSPADHITVTSRIHVSDVVHSLHVSMENPRPGEVYNVADNEPCSRFELLSYIVQGAKNMREKSPILELLGNMEVPLSTTMPNQSSRGGSKRVDNKKLRHFLRTCGSDLRFPNYRRGVDALFDEYFPSQLMQ